MYKLCMYLVCKRISCNSYTLIATLYRQLPRKYSTRTDFTNFPSLTKQGFVAAATIAGAAAVKLGEKNSEEIVDSTAEKSAEIVDKSVEEEVASAAKESSKEKDAQSQVKAILEERIDLYKVRTYVGYLQSSPRRI